MFSQVLWARRVAVTVLLTVCASWGVAPTEAQVVQQAIGGVRIDAEGAIRNIDFDQFARLRQIRLAAMQPAQGEMGAFTPLRKVSLRHLQEVLSDHVASGKPLPDEIRYLAGLQRVEYILVYPEYNDIVLAGPAEGWVVNHEGNVVGKTTGRPVLNIEDLLVALRTTEATQKTGITCSIEPTEQGVVSLEAFFRRVGSIGPDPRPTMAQMERVLGLQNILITGVPGSSHFAMVLVAADYRMKRLAMNFDDAPVAGFPSFMEMASKRSRVRSTMPRWWLATNYEALLRDDDGLAWQLRGEGVRTLSEEDFVANGKRQRSGKTSPLVKKWADLMTAKYDELSTRNSIFGELRNCMDLSVVAALIAREQLAEKAGFDMALLLDDEKLKVASYQVPKHVDSLASVVRTGRSWLVSVSGGVDIDPWEIASQQTVQADLSDLRNQAAQEANNWWWN